MAVAPDGTWLATTIRDGPVRIWDPATGQADTPLTRYDRLSAVAFAPDGTWLATGSEDGPVRTWDPATGQQQALLTGHTGPVTAVAVAPDGTWLATASRDGPVRIWDPATGGMSAVMRVDRPLEDCAWSPSGQSLAAAGVCGLYHFTFKGTPLREGPRKAHGAQPVGEADRLG